MTHNLDVLRTEILDHLHERKIAVFHGAYRSPDLAGDAVYWDVEREPDYKLFVEAAEQAGVRLMVFHPQVLASQDLEEAFERLHESEMDRDDQREFERRLRELRGYEGFTCAVELSFAYANRIYIFDLRADWFEEFQEMLDEIDAYLGDDTGGPPLGGFFSQN
jgi:hypothetical protein